MCAILCLKYVACFSVLEEVKVKKVLCISDECLSLVRTVKYYWELGSWAKCSLYCKIIILLQKLKEKNYSFKIMGFCGKLTSSRVVVVNIFILTRFGNT